MAGGRSRLGLKLGVPGQAGCVAVSDFECLGEGQGPSGVPGPQLGTDPELDHVVRCPAPGGLLLRVRAVAGFWLTGSSWCPFPAGGWSCSGLGLGFRLGVQGGVVGEGEGEPGGLAAAGGPGAGVGGQGGDDRHPAAPLLLRPGLVLPGQVR